MDLPVYFPMTAAALSVAYTLCGRGAEVVPLLTPARAQTMAAGRVTFQALCSLSLGGAYVSAGLFQEAHALAEEALTLARTHQERGHQAWTLHLLGEIATHRKPPEVEQAEAHYRQALALTDELGMRPLLAHCHLGLGTLYARTDRREQARAALSAAIDLYRAMEMTFWLPQAEAALAQVEG